MNPKPDLDAYIDRRIARLSRGPRAATGRLELKEHVLDAATARARDAPMTQHHVDDAFASLGDDAAIRDAFFPTRPAVPLGRVEALVLIAAAVLVAAGRLIETGDTASCSVSAGGTCTAEASGFIADTLLVSTPPLLLLACRAWLPVWTPWLVAIPYVVFGFLRWSASWGSEIAPEWGDIAIVFAALICVAVAARVTLPRGGGTPA